MNVPSWSVAALAILAGFYTASASAMAGPANLVFNGGFRQVADGRPVGWVAAGNPERVAQSLTVVPDAGNPCARLSCTRIEGQGGDVHAMIAQVGRRKFAVRPTIIDD